MKKKYLIIIYCFVFSCFVFAKNIDFHDIVKKVVEYSNKFENQYTNDGSNYSFTTKYQIKSGFKSLNNSIDYILVTDDFEKAIVNFDKAIKSGCLNDNIIGIYSISVCAYDLLTRTYLSQVIGDWNQDTKNNIVREYNNILKANNKFDIANKVVGDFFFDLEIYDYSLYYYKKCSTLDDETNFKIGDMYFNSKSYPLASEYYKKTNEKNIGLRKIADLYFKLNDLDAAEKYYLMIDGINNDDYQKLAIAFENENNIEKAKYYYEKINDKEKINSLENKQDKDNALIKIETSITGDLGKYLLDKKIFVDSILDAFKYRKAMDWFNLLLLNNNIKIKSQSESNLVNILVILENYDVSYLVKGNNTLDYISTYPINLIYSAIKMYSVNLMKESKIYNVKYNLSFALEKNNNFCIFNVNDYNGVLIDISFVTSDGKNYTITGRPYGPCYYIDPPINKATGQNNTSSLLYSFFGLMKRNVEQ